jgi:hypothetical protein
MTKVENTADNEKKCRCPGCPTWHSSDCPKEKTEYLYCAKGKTACDLSDKGCLCGMCPVFEENNLSGGYFCFNGIAE